MSEPRPMTADELRDDLFASMRRLARFWADAKPDGKTVLERIEGAMFSVLVLLDGHAGDSVCAYDLVARPHPSDKEYHIEEGQNWVEDGTTISELLHEKWHKA
jgi:hypothetical protein